MADLQNGKLVLHRTLGVGKIVALEPNAVHVFFPDSDKRFAAKLRLPAARALLRTDGFEPNAWLEGLSAFTFDAKTGRYALAARWLTHDEAVEQFLAVFPRGFADPAYVGNKDARAARWRAAHARWTEVFGEREGEALVAEGDLDEVVKRIRSVEERIAPLHPAADVGAVRDALSSPASSRPFLAALFELLSVPSPGRSRFEKLFAAARDLPVDAAQQWLVATLFPFVASPGRQVLLRPKIVRGCGPAGLQSRRRRFPELGDVRGASRALGSAPRVAPAERREGLHRRRGLPARHGDGEASPLPERAMNDNFRDLKERIRKLDALLADGGSQDLSFAQAVSALRRAAKHGDRTRDPSPALRALLEKAEILGRSRTRSTS